MMLCTKSESCENSRCPHREKHIMSHMGHCKKQSLCGGTCVSVKR